HAGVGELRSKSLQLTAYLRQEIIDRLSNLGVRLVTPPEDHRRGGHITLSHSDAGRLSRALRARGVIPDFRPPDLLRLAPAPLYTSFSDCERAIDILEEILITAAHEHLPDHDGRVT